MRHFFDAAVFTALCCLRGELRHGGETASKPEPVSEHTPTFRNIAIDGVTISGAKRAVDIAGLPEMPVQNLRLTDVTGHGQVALTARYTVNLQLRQPAFSRSQTRTASPRQAASLHYFDL